MEWIKLNGINSNTINGLIIKDLGEDNLPQKDIESIKVAGKNGNMHIDNGTYNSITRTIVCVATDLEKINDIISFLKPIGTIELSTHEGIYRNYVINNQVPFSKYLSYLREFPIQLELSPIGYSITETVVTKTTTPGTFTVGGTIGVSPILEIKGSGEVTVTLNGKVFTLSNCDSTAYIVDCDLMNVTKSSVQKNDEFTGNFPELIVGTNTISWTGSVSEVKIKYKEGWL